MTKLIDIFVNNILLDVPLVGSTDVTVPVVIVMSLVRENVSVEDDRMFILSLDSIPIKDST